MLSTLSDPFTEWPKNLAIVSRAQNERKLFKKSRLLWQQLCHHIIQKVQWYLKCQWQEFLVRVGQRRHSCAALGGGVKQQQFYSSYCCLFSAVSPPAWGSSWVCKDSTSLNPSSSSSNSMARYVCLALWWWALLLQGSHAIKVRCIKNYDKFQSVLVLVGSSLFWLFPILYPSSVPDSLSLDFKVQHQMWGQLYRHDLIIHHICIRSNSCNYMTYRYRHCSVRASVIEPWLIQHFGWILKGYIP